MDYHLTAPAAFGMLAAYGSVGGHESLCALRSVVLDWMRSVLESLSACTAECRTPRLPRLADARASTILEFDAPIRCSLAMNHTYKHGPEHQDASLRMMVRKDVPGLNGVLLNYPEGKPDEMEIKTQGTDGFVAVPLQGGSFRDRLSGLWLTCSATPPVKMTINFVL